MKSMFLIIQHKKVETTQQELLGFSGWLVGFLTSSSTARLYRRRAPRLTADKIQVLPHTRQSGETMTSVSAGHIILTQTQREGSGRPQQGSNPGPPHQETHALPTELPPPPRAIVSQTGIYIGVNFWWGFNNGK